MTDTPKLCKDCRHYRPPAHAWLFGSTWKANNARCAWRVEPVEGLPARAAWRERFEDEDGKCGPGAKNWEPQP